MIENKTQFIPFLLTSGNPWNIMLLSVTTKYTNVKSTTVDLVDRSYWSLTHMFSS